MVVELWERALHQRGGSSKVLVSDGQVVVHERRSRLVCLDAADGTLRWDRPVGPWPRALVNAGGRVLVVSNDRLSCLDPRTGDPHWQVGLPRWSAHVAVADGAVLTGGWRGYTAPAAFDLADGRPRWTSPARSRTELPVAWAGGFLLGDGPRAWLLDPRDGREAASWRLPLPLAGADGGAVFTVLDEDRCVAVCGSRTLAVLHRGGQVELLRPHRHPLLGGAPLRADGLLWLREARPGGWVAVDPLDGIPWRRTALPGRPVAAGVVRTAGGVAVALEDGALLRAPGVPSPAGRERVGDRIAAVHELGADRLLAVTRSSLRAWQL
ncbi:PQQ-binding-like beta-propeller repeat protein [Streptomyces sp. TLI_171]|uniref:PQQ-binding-like beta-propeller repeat protein n=1 Tax=Streptomyces sp. TLI_171 TaxID=1938859 RepID=UPI000C3A2530|nr:PQQ-binding-like beta-propeller repeat protein [Streptomyces sp. TLI_171]RKE17753.1 outer membrane protein assembly factor BamB [Streptomyces sp. TLI_171]